MSKRRVRLQRREPRPQAQAPDAPLLNSESGSSRTAGEAALRFRQLPDRQRHTDAEPRPGQAAAAGRDAGFPGRGRSGKALCRTARWAFASIYVSYRGRSALTGTIIGVDLIYLWHIGGQISENFRYVTQFQVFLLLCLVSIVDMKITERLDMPGLSTIKRPGLIRQSHISCSDETGRSSQAAQVLKNLCRLAF